MLKKLCAGLVIFNLIPQVFPDLTARQRAFRLAHNENIEAIKHKIRTKTNSALRFLS